MTAASLTFGPPAAPGSYELRVFAHNGYTPLATSAIIVVTPSPATLSVNGVARFENATGHS